MVQVLAHAGHEIHGLDSSLFEHCTFGVDQPDVPARRVDLRDVQTSDLRGFDAVIHLAAISNDPLGNLNPQGTYDINHLASVRLAEKAREAGVQRFLFASSCTTYGLSGSDDLLTENATFNPLTPYGESKVLVERDVTKLATHDFSPLFLRNATAHGVSPRLRADIVVNNLVGRAFTTARSGERATGHRGARSCTSRIFHVPFLPSSRRRAKSFTTRHSTWAGPRRTTGLARSRKWSVRWCQAVA
jgi:nucleoside-diphosphate-sugar epimerase